MKSVISDVVNFMTAFLILLNPYPHGNIFQLKELKRNVESVGKKSKGTRYDSKVTY